MFSPPTQNQQECLVHGYIRENCIFSVPIVLIKLFVLYFNSIFYWHFQKDKLKELLSMKNTEEIYSNKFKYNNLSFHLSLSPNGYSQTNSGYIEFYLECVKCDFDIISNVIVYAELFCYHNNTLLVYHKQIKLLTSDNIASGWNHNTLKLSECLNLKSLTFGCNIDIEYKNQKICRYRKDNIFMKAKTECKWNINNKVLNELRNGEYGNDDKKYIGPSFDNNNWCFGCMHRCYDEINVGIELHRLPQKIKSIWAVVKPYIIEDNVQRCDNQITQLVSYSNTEHFIGWIPKLSKHLKDITSLSLKVEIQILSAYDMNEKLITPVHFKEYGINEVNVL